MEKILHIIASPKHQASRTLDVSRSFLETIKKKHPQVVVDELDLSEVALPELHTKEVEGKASLLSGKEMSKESQEAWRGIVQHIERFLSADFYLVSTPMWNFSIPYMLKHYIDVIVQPKYLFRYTDSGVEGLAKNKKMVIVSSRGGDYSTSETQHLDFINPYLTAIFGFVGINDITFLKAEPMDMGGELKHLRLEEAKQQAEKFASTLPS